MKIYSEYLDKLLCSDKSNPPGLLSSEWELLNALCDKFDCLPDSEAHEFIAQFIANPKSSGPLIRAMKAIAHDRLEMKLYSLANQ